MVKEINNFQMFLELIKENNYSNNIYLTYEYYSIFCSFHPELEKDFCAYVVYREDKSILGLLPLIKRIFDFVILGYRYSNYLGYICEENDTLSLHQQLSTFFETSYPNIIITFYDINSENALFGLLYKENETKKAFLYNCPYCTLDESFESLFMRQFTKSKKRTEIRKFERKLNNLGNVKLFNINKKEDIYLVVKYFEQVLNVHKKRFENVYIPDDLSLYKNGDYYYNLLVTLLDSEKAYISIITLDDRVISFVYMVISGNIIIDWMPAFDPIFSKYSLGTVHLMKIMEFLCGKEEYKTFDFSKGDSLYKERWSNGITANYVFVRRYSNSAIAILKQCFALIPFILKGWLREKGLMNRIKNFIGIIKNSRNGNVKQRVRREYIVNRVADKDVSLNYIQWVDFSYEKLTRYDDNVRELLVNSFYEKPYKEFAIYNEKIFVL